MRPTLKTLHLLGLALFLGSLPGHIIIGHFGPDSGIPIQGVVFARHLLQALCLFSTLPGLILLLVSGLLAWRDTRRNHPLGRWLALHIGFGLAVVANGAAVLTPVIFTLTATAHGLMDGAEAQAAWDRAKQIEDIAGTLNLLMALVCLGLGVWHRRLTARIKP